MDGNLIRSCDKGVQDNIEKLKGDCEEMEVSLEKKNYEKELLQKEVEKRKNDDEVWQEKLKECKDKSDFYTGEIKKYERQVYKIFQFLRRRRDMMIQNREAEIRMNCALKTQLLKIKKGGASQIEYSPDRDFDSLNVPINSDDQNRMQSGYVASPLVEKLYSSADLSDNHLTQDDDDDGDDVDDEYNGSRSNLGNSMTMDGVFTNSNKFSTRFQDKCAIDESSVVTPVTSSERSNIYPAPRNPLTPLQPSLQEDFNRKQECERPCSFNSSLPNHASPNFTSTNSHLPSRKRNRIPDGSTYVECNKQKNSFSVSTNNTAKISSIIDNKVDNSDGFSTPMARIPICTIEKSSTVSLATPTERSNTSYNTQNGDRSSLKRKEMHLARNEDEIFEERHESLSPLPSTSQVLDLSSYSVTNKNDKDNRRETIADRNSGAPPYQSSSNLMGELDHSLNAKLKKKRSKTTHL